MLEKIQEVLAESLNINPSEVKAESHLREDLGIDSIAAVELALELETAFDIEIEDEELEKIVTINDIIKIVESKQE